MNPASLTRPQGWGSELEIAHHLFKIIRIPSALARIATSYPLLRCEQEEPAMLSTHVVSRTTVLLTRKGALMSTRSLTPSPSARRLGRSGVWRSLLALIFVALVLTGGGVAKAQYTTLDDPSADPVQGTNIVGINNQGQMVGEYWDSTSHIYGFLLNNGVYTTLDVPNATAEVGYGNTFASGINDKGQIVGYYFDSAGGAHGFLLSQGVYTTLDDPNAGSGTYALGINNQGQIVGTYFDSAGGAHGFLLNKGVYTTLDDPNAGSSIYGSGTLAGGINDKGQIVGQYYDSTGGVYGFLLSKGVYTTLHDPNAVAEAGLGTYAAGINNQGLIVGGYLDSNGAENGFLLIP